MRAARLCRGYGSARTAAETFGFGASLCGAQEAGQRKVSADDRKLYAQSYGVSEDWLASGKASCPWDLAAEDWLQNGNRGLERSAEARARSAGRLNLARRLAGFSTVAETCREFGWTRPGYAASENGYAGITPECALRYAVAFGVNPRWRVDGTAPSGLGLKIDEMGANAKWVEDSDMGYLVDPLRRGRPEPPRTKSRRGNASRHESSGRIRPVVDPETIGAFADMLSAFGESVDAPLLFEILIPPRGSRLNIGDVVAVAKRSGEPGALHAVRGDDGAWRLVSDLGSALGLGGAPSRGRVDQGEIVGKVVFTVSRF